MEIMVRDLPIQERPREKLIKNGAVFLSDAELLAILLRTGTKGVSALHIAEQVLACYKDMGLSAINYMSPVELAKIDGVGLAKAATIIAAVELGRRLAKSNTAKIVAVNSPEDVFDYAMPHFKNERREHFAALLLNTKNQIIAMPIISIGSLSASIVHPREVFRAAIKYASASLILLHNHPSGDPSPSREDVAVTERMIKTGKIMDIPVLDHIIIGDNRFVSLKERGLIL